MRTLACHLGSPLPLGDRAASVGNEVAFEADRIPAAVADLVSLLLLELVVPFGCQQHEPVFVPDVLHVGETTPLAIGFLAFAQVDAVFRDRLLIEQSWIFAEFDSAGDVEPIAVSQIADSDLLD